MFYIGSLKNETAPQIQQVIRLTLGGSEIWAYTTTPQDVSLRRRMSQKVGLNNALRILTKQYPNGSAKADIQLLLSDNAVDFDEHNPDMTIFDILVDRLIRENTSLIDNAKIPVVR